MRPLLDCLILAIAANPADRAAQAALADHLQENPHLIYEAVHQLAAHLLVLSPKTAMPDWVGGWMAEDWSDHWLGDVADCPHCHGTGFYDTGVCNVCDGSG